MSIVSARASKRLGLVKISDIVWYKKPHPVWGDRGIDDIGYPERKMVSTFTVSNGEIIDTKFGYIMNHSCRKVVDAKLSYLVDKKKVMAIIAQNGDVVKDGSYMIEMPSSELRLPYLEARSVKYLRIMGTWGNRVKVSMWRAKENGFEEFRQKDTMVGRHTTYLMKYVGSDTNLIILTRKGAFKGHYGVLGIDNCHDVEVVFNDYNVQVNIEDLKI